MSVFIYFKAREGVNRCPSYQSPRSGRGLPGVGSRPLPVAKALGQSVTVMAAGRHDGFTDQDVVLTEINSSRLRFRVGGGVGVMRDCQSSAHGPQPQGSAGLPLTLFVLR